MIHYIRGELATKLGDRVVVETGGIGYEIFVPANASVYGKSEGEQVRLYTAMMVKEDDVSLYGFPDRESLSAFHKLLAVNGVGAKAAMAVLSAMTLSEFTRAVVFGDAPVLTRANGVGKKSAERIILELKDKMSLREEAGEGGDPLSRSSGFGAFAPGDARAEALEALVSLGYSRSEAASALAGVAGEGLEAEAYIKQALKRI
jgi:Holliday junction DNA helicase RuvA